MKIKKFISSSLTVGLLLNTIIPSLASTLSEDGRYEAIEGEYITIDDSTEGELLEVEVFGNTVQDDNDLEDIQSVGDLYIDKNGNPILDSQGREQYKIDIVSVSRLNLIDKISPRYQSSYDGYIEDFANGYTFKNIADTIGTNVKFYMDCDTSKEYTVQVDVTNNTSSSLCRFLKHTAYHSIVEVEPGQKKRVKFKVSPYAGDILFYLNMQPIKANESVIFENFIVLEGDYEADNFNIDDCSPNKSTILLPQPLLSLNSRTGNKKLSDKLFWSDSLGKYIIEKNISIIKIKKFNSKYQTFFQLPEIENPDNIDLGPLYWYEYVPLVQKMEYTGWGQVPKNSNYGIGVYSNASIRCYQKAGIDSTLDELNSYIGDDGINMYTQLYNYQIIETNITSKLKIPTYEGSTHVFVDSENGINPTLKVTVDRTINRAKEAIELAKVSPTVENLALARMWTNLIKESAKKDELQGEINSITEVEDLELERKSVTANMDLYVRSENALSMSLDTNSVTFEGYSGVSDMEKLSAVNISINSSLPYSLNAYMPVELSNSDGSNKMPINLLNIRQNGEGEYKRFASTTDKIILKDGCEAGNDIVHKIDLKLSSTDAHKADIYKAVIKFEAEQK